jgi:hypothetical protein
MDMNLEEKIRVGEILISILDKETKSLDDPYDDYLPQFIQKAYGVKMRMLRFSMSHDEPPEMLAQLEKMDGIIKRLMDLQNKKCY